MKKLTIGILAHVDAGKTTLTESLLYVSGMIRKQGKVDDRDTFLDTEALEKKRGVTIHSKIAIIDLPHGSRLNKKNEDLRLNVVDTPGHSDFAGEAERSLLILDLAVLLISAKEALSDTTKRFTHLLNSRHVPYVIFVNKMDISDLEKADIFKSLCGSPGSGILEYRPDNEESLEDIAALSEETIEKYLNTLALSDGDIASLIYSCAYHPVIFGSASKNEGTEELLKLIAGYLPEFSCRDRLSMRIFRIVHEDRHRLCFAKITGGKVDVRDTVPDERLEGEKITEIRLYNGARYESLSRAEAGDVVALAGLENAFAGMGTGDEKDDLKMICHPVLSYRLILPEDVPLVTFMPAIRELAGEDPLLNPVVSGDDDKVSISVMGEFQLEILALTIEERFGIKAGFEKGSIIYKETIEKPVIGYGHFEPLRHYAEIHILMEPLPRDSGIIVESRLSTDELDINWQKTVMTALKEELPAGVLTGSDLTDIRFSLISGRSHTKHTESQDFREAARRAVRQGLMKAECRLLEPCYEYSVILPTDCLGRAMNDINLMKGSFLITSQDEEYSVLEGCAPAKGIFNYQSELTKYTSGRGRITFSFSGYRECAPEEETAMIEERAYDPDNDPANVSGSVFTRQGAGRYFPWDECEALMHAPKREAQDYY